MLNEADINLGEPNGITDGAMSAFDRRLLPAGPRRIGMLRQWDVR